MHDDELVAAVAHRGGLVAGGVLDATGDRHHEPVADLVAVRVVHELEAVEVAEEGRHLDGGVVGGAEPARQHIGERGAVRQAGQRIVTGEPSQLSLRACGAALAAPGDDRPCGGRRDERREYNVRDKWVNMVKPPPERARDS